MQYNMIIMINYGKSSIEINVQKCRVLQYVLVKQND